MKLWQTKKSQVLDPKIEDFTIGSDRDCDAQLIYYDALASLAHAQTLRQAKFLTHAECQKIQKVLAQVLRKPTVISLQNFEDGPSALEDFLTQKLGDLGAKIHLGRSRNDQTATTLRLFGQQALRQIQCQILAVIEALLTLTQTWQKIPWPGYTHARPAMLTSVGHFFAAFAESLKRDYLILKATREAFDTCPLGAAAGFGSSIYLERKLTAKLLGFAGVENNTLGTQLTRGSFEAQVSAILAQIFLPLSRLAQDLIYFSAPEFGYFALTEKIATGSSIMPQKRNPDALEILRGISGSLLGKATEIFQITKGLPAGYARDLQLTKKPFLESLNLAKQALRALPIILANLKVQPEQCVLSASKTEIFATEKANALVVQKGLNFREAYREIKQNLKNLESEDPQKFLPRLKIQGAAGNLNLGLLKRFLKQEKLVIKNYDVTKN